MQIIEYFAINADAGTRRPQVSLQLAKKNAETRSYTARFSIL